MFKHFQRRTLLPLCMLLCVFFAACSTSKVGTIPRGTPDHGNGTPAIVPTSSRPLPTETAPPNTVGTTYAFVRKNQLCVAAKNSSGGKPAQVTNFDYSQLPEAFWHQPVWSPDDHSLAMIMSAQHMGLGGGGCPGPDYGATGALYVMDVMTKQFTQITLPAVNNNAQVTGMPRTDYWQEVFWEDGTHLLAWYNGVTGKTSEAAGLYRYDLNTHKITLLVPLHTLGAATLANPQKGLPLILSMRYSSGQLFYQLVVHPFEQQSQVMIYSRSLAHPEMQSKKLLQVGTEGWCATPVSGPFVKPGWDISPSGEQLVAQTIVVNDPRQGASTIQALNLNDNSTTELFTKAPSDVLAHDLALAWGPNSQIVVATAYHMTGQGGPYTASLANPTVLQQYTPNLAGQVVWRSDSSAFVLQSAEVADVTTPSNIYVFLTGETQGRVLLADAYNFSWG